MLKIKDEGSFWRLKRGAKLVKEAQEIKWIEFDRWGAIKKICNEMKIGNCLILSPFSEYFTWLTSPITEIVSGGPGSIFDKNVTFKTKESEYELILVDIDQLRFELTHNIRLFDYKVKIESDDIQYLRDLELKVRLESLNNKVI